MKILKYKALKNHEYKIITDSNEYKLYDDIIIKYQLLLKKDICEVEFNNILKENNLIKAYYVGVSAITVKLRTEKEMITILKKKGFNNEEIKYAIDNLRKNHFLDHNLYIEAYIHDMLNMHLMGEKKIYNNLCNLGFMKEEIEPFLKAVDKSIYQDKIKNYINKKVKSNKSSIMEFKRKTLKELIDKGFEKGDITNYLDSLDIIEDEDMIKKLVNKLYNKYINKYDLYTTKLKIKNYLYQKGYNNINIDDYLDIS